MISKTCTKCGSEKAATTEFWGKKEGGRYGLKSRCKECEKLIRAENKDYMKDYNKKYREQNREELSRKQKEFYRNNKKKYVEYQEKNRERKKLYMEEWREKNREHVLEYDKNYKENNRELIKSRARKYYSENREKMVLKAQEIRKANPEKAREISRRSNTKRKTIRDEENRRYREQNREKALLALKEWRKNNKETVRLYRHRRKARKRLLFSEATAKDITAMNEKFNFACALTGETEDLQLEHFIPLSWGHGGTYIGNVYPITRELNQSKGNKNPFEWIKAEMHRVDMKKWKDLISYLADEHGLSPIEFRRFVYWCERNQRTIEEIKSDGEITSLELWLKSAP